MAEGVLYSLASKLLGEITSDAVRTAYGRVHSIWGAKEDLERLKDTVVEIQDVLLDAEQKQLESAPIREWIRMLRDVLYDADDLLDLAATDALLKQQMKGNNKLRGEVRDLFSKLNPVISNNDFAKKVKAVRKRLDSLSKDMTQFGFTPSPCENQMSVVWKRETCSFVDQKVVFGRDDDKNAILELLFDKSHEGQSVPVIAIVGIGSIGKTILAQLVYNNEKVSKNFDRRWWVAIGGISDGKEILARIFESISMGKNCHDFSISQLQSAIVESMSGAGKYLLVLDDMWEYTASSRFYIMSMLRSGTIGSRIIITTRYLSVAKAVCAEHKQIYRLLGLTEDESWALFKTLAFQSDQECTPDQISLGREIIDHCNGFPLAIKSIASILSTKKSIQEWQFFANEKTLFDSNVKVMSILRLSYNELPSTLKQCLAYCSLFPKDYVFQKEELTYLWIGQGFVMPKSDGSPVEEIVYGYLMELFDRSFFRDATVDENGEVLRWTMHGLIHDLVQSVAGNESIIITERFDQNYKKIRHLSIGYELDSSWSIPPSLFHMDRPPLRSFLFLYEGSLSPRVLDKLLTKFKLLRALNLRHQKIEVVPSSIGELKHLRYLNLSHNKFMNLPNSITELVNLLTLDISWCKQLELLPYKFRNLCNLRHLDTKRCYRLRHMPPGLENLTSLQCLSFFKVGKAMDASNSKLNVLAGLKLRGELEIKFEEDWDWVENECLQLPIGIRVLTINSYPGMRLPCLKTTTPSVLPNLVSLYIGPSSTIEHLPLFRGLPSLQTLQLSYLEQLECIEILEDETKGGKNAGVTSDYAVLFPSLKVLTLEGLPKLKRWSRKVEAAFTSQDRETECLPVLANLTVGCCQELKFMPLCPRLQMLELNDVNDELIQHLLSTSFDASSSSAPVSFLETVAIWGCDLPSFPGATLKSLHHLQVRFCDELKNLYLVPSDLNTLEELVIQNCPELELWEEDKRGVDWDALPKLCKLTVIGMPNPDKLPDCLQQRQTHGTLLINMD